MKESGIVRKLDDLGRIVIPMEIRKELGISPRDSLEIYVADGKIMLERHDAACVFCGGKTGLEEYKEKHICKSCLSGLKK